MSSPENLPRALYSKYLNPCPAELGYILHILDIYWIYFAKSVDPDQLASEAM